MTFWMTAAVLTSDDHASPLTYKHTRPVSWAMLMCMTDPPKNVSTGGSSGKPGGNFTQSVWIRFSYGVPSGPRSSTRHVPTSFSSAYARTTPGPNSRFTCSKSCRIRAVLDRVRSTVAEVSVPPKREGGRG